jgi:hypothetical protein
MRYPIHQALLHRTLALAALIILLAAATAVAALRAHSDTSFAVSRPASNATSAEAMTIPSRPIHLGR